MPLVRRPLANWQTYRAQAAAPGPDLARGWPSELPDPAEVRARLPRITAAPGTAPTGRGRPNLQQLGLGVAPTGEPSMGASRSSIFMTPMF